MTVRVYADICGDLFHAGHVNLLRAARAMGDELYVGVMNDTDMTAYKRAPILTMSERIAVVEACRYVDRVVPNSPIVTTLEFLDHWGIDLVVHGDDYSAEEMEAYYGGIMRAGRFATLPYTGGISTSDIVARIKARSDL